LRAVWRVIILARRPLVLLAARYLVIIAAIQVATIALAGSAERSLPLCTDPPIVATMTVVDGMPFITPRRLSFHAVAPPRGARLRDFGLFDGRQPLAQLSFESDGSIQVIGEISVSADGTVLRVITNRPGHCINNMHVVANSAPTWHLVTVSSVN
jgi:hypothetical protein